MIRSLERAGYLVAKAATSIGGRESFSYQIKMRILRQFVKCATSHGFISGTGYGKGEPDNGDRREDDGGDEGSRLK